MSDDDHKDYLLFIAQDTLQEIRENKKDQRTIAFNFILITGALFGLFEIIKTKVNPQLSQVVLKLLVSSFAATTIYLIIKLQGSLSHYRKRISKIWDAQGFKFAFQKKILRYKNDCKEQYFSFWHHFWDFTFLYIVIVALVALLVIFL